MPIQQPDKPINNIGNVREKPFSLLPQLATPAVDASLILSKNPALTVSHSTLSFTQRSADKPAFLLLTVAQQQADTPVTITTDLPECIQLASDSRPTFGPALTLIPAATGTYVHVRYFARRRGLHTGQLTIQAPYATTTVALEGRKTGLLPVMRTAQSSDNQLIIKEPGRTRFESRWAIGLSVAAIVSGLAYAGHTYRCQFFPDLCQSVPAVQRMVQHSVPVSDKPTPTDIPGNIVRDERTIKNKKSEEAGHVFSASSGSSTGQRNSTRSRVSQMPVAKQDTDEQENVQSRRRSVPVAPTEESDLERELNQGIDN